MPVILLTNKYSKKVLNVVRNELPKRFDFISLDKLNKDELLEKASLADYFLASGRLSIDKEIIEAARKLKMIQRTGVGTDTLDLDTLKSKNIPVYVNTGVNSFSVAEHTILLMLSVLRRLHIVDTGLKAGIWQKNDIGIENRSLNNKTIGLIGLGNIGKHVAKILEPFGGEISYFDLNRLNKKEEQKLNIKYFEFENILKQADILSLHCPLTNKTKGLIGKKELSIMKSGSYIINTARGALINEEALVAAMQSGHIRGAGLDVFCEEPLEKGNPLLSLNNIVLTPHIGGLTLETFSKMVRDAFNNIRLFDIGRYDLIDNKKLQ